MRHLNLVFRSTKPERFDPVAGTYCPGRWPSVCCGCAEPFPIRDGRREAQVGDDGRLYCYNRTPKCTVLAIRPAA
jgi:hypothetical protein